MTARVIQIERKRGRGRQPFDVEERQILREELTALIDEGRELGAQLVALARRAQVLLAAGHSPANLLDELERLGLRHSARMTAAGVDQRSDDACPDGLEAMGHGAAA